MGAAVMTQIKEIRGDSTIEILRSLSYYVLTGPIFRLSPATLASDTLGSEVRSRQSRSSVPKLCSAPQHSLFSLDEIKAKMKC